LLRGENKKLSQNNQTDAEQKGNLVPVEPPGKLVVAEQTGKLVAAKPPRILVFSTNNISDIGIDLAGSSHMDYPTSVQVISVPCSSGISPQWILHALEAGFDGVFIAADGSDCAYLSDCTERTGRIVEQAQTLLKNSGRDASRLKMAAICSVCSESFVSHIKKFNTLLSELNSTSAQARGEK
jgi:F420-non-reducing hydrogenase iron-sulfur subunit